MIEKTQNSKVCIFDVDNDNINKLNSRGNDDNDNINKLNSLGNDDNDNINKLNSRGNDDNDNCNNSNKYSECNNFANTKRKNHTDKSKHKNNMKNSPHMELITAKLKFEKISTIGGGADRNDQQSVLKVELETGRKHQIRAQLSHIG